MKIKLNILFLIILSGFVLADGDDCPNCYNPIADAGNAITYSYGCSSSITQICLDGSGSNDYEESILVYHWSLHNVENSSGQISPSLWPNIPFNDIQNSSPCFEAPYSNEELYYTFKLVVNDGQYTSPPDFVTITVAQINTPPYFSTNPETNYSLKLYESFILDLSSLSDNTLNGSTSDGYVLDVDLSEFSSGFSIVDHGNYIYTLTAISLSSPPDGYTLTVSDECDDMQYDITTEIIGNEAPYSIAGPNQNIWSGDTFTLDAGLSFDPDGDTFNYVWTIPASLSDQMQNQSVNDQVLTFTSDENSEEIYTFELNLEGSDGEQEQSSVPNNGEDLFFSEYYEPVSSGYSKYVEIYNSTIDKIDLSDYEVWYVDGAYQWDDSGIASSFPVTGKLLFNSCLGQMV